MQIQSTGGIFLRQDANGNLNIYNTSGTSLAKFVGTAFSPVINKVQLTLDGTAFSSTSVLSSGSGVSFANKISTKMLMILSGVGSSNTAGDGVILYLYTSTIASGIPTAGNAPGGSDQVLVQTQMLSPAIGNVFSISRSDIVFAGGTLPGLFTDSYNYYLAGQTTTGGTFTLSKGSMVLIEL